jgi:hypothetical protein
MSNLKAGLSTDGCAEAGVIKNVNGTIVEIPIDMARMLHRISFFSNCILGFSPLKIAVDW